MATAQTTIRTVMAVMSVNVAVPTVSRITSLWVREIRCPARMNSALAIVMIPSPPINISSRMTACPPNVQ